MEGRIELTLKDIAILLDGVEVPDATARRLAPFLRQDSRLVDEIAELEQMVSDAGIGAEQPEPFTIAYSNDRDFRRLLTAPEWKRPDEVLDPETGFSVDELLRVAQARFERSPNPLLAAVKKKLELALSVQQAVERLMDVFVQELMHLPGTDALASLAEMGRRYRDRMKAAQEGAADNS